jgi:hypothetical protein
MDPSEKLEVAEVHMAFLRRRINELERQVESVDGERAYWMGIGLKFKNAVADHRETILKYPPSLGAANERLWEKLHD